MSDNIKQAIERLRKWNAWQSMNRSKTVYEGTRNRFDADILAVCDALEKAMPTNPYGCRCEWKRDDHCNRHILWRGEVYFYSTSCDFCPSCGKAKRREQ